MVEAIEADEADEEEADVEEVEGFAGAADLAEALLLLLAEAVGQCHADVALVHDVRDDGAVVVCSHGERMFELLGDRIPPHDPVALAAAMGNTVLAEPTPGIAGRKMRARLSKQGQSATGALMVPVVSHGRLLAMLEIGRATPFRGRDVTLVEELVAELVHEVEASGWVPAWPT